VKGLALIPLVTAVRLVAGHAEVPLPDTHIDLQFEASSSRLVRDQAEQMDRLVELIRRNPGTRLILFLPPARDDLPARFVAARAAEVDRLLRAVGLSAQHEKTAAPSIDSVSLAWLPSAPNLAFATDKKPAVSGSNSGISEIDEGTPISPDPAKKLDQSKSEFPSGPLLAEWRLMGAAKGRAWVMPPGDQGLGLEEIEQGHAYSLIGSVVSIGRRQGQWLVQTSQGYLTPPSPARSHAAHLPSDPSDDGDKESFGDRLPLHIALASIVPIEIAVTVDQQAELEQATSWNSDGLTWRQTLETALQPLHLTVRYSDSAIAIVAASPALQTWQVEPGTMFRDQIARWLPQANQEGCGTPSRPCFRLAEAGQGEAVEPWFITVTDAFQGDFLGALTWLRDGFWKSPRPDIEVTKNNVIVLRSLGGSP